MWARGRVEMGEQALEKEMVTVREKLQRELLAVADSNVRVVSELQSLQAKLAQQEKVTCPEAGGARLQSTICKFHELSNDAMTEVSRRWTSTRAASRP